MFSTCRTDIFQMAMFALPIVLLFCEWISSRGRTSVSTHPVWLTLKGHAHRKVFLIQHKI